MGAPDIDSAIEVGEQILVLSPTCVQDVPQVRRGERGFVAYAAGSCALVGFVTVALGHQVIHALLVEPDPVVATDEDGAGACAENPLDPFNDALFVGRKRFLTLIAPATRGLKRVVVLVERGKIAE